MASGIPISDESYNAYERVKNRNLRGAILKIENNEIVVEELFDNSSSSESTWENLCSRLKSKECRYILYDFEFTVASSKRSKVSLALWAPDTASVEG
jgi:cofilin